MSSRRAERRRACRGKERYESKEEALRQIRNLHRHDSFRQRMSAYLCRFCYGWHVGHLPGKVAAAIRARRGE